jgi:FtsH-binding integral membrane protein
VITVYERLQTFILKTFELTFLELIALGFPVSIATILLTLSGMNPPLFPILIVIFIGMIWVLCYIAMWWMRDVWTIPIRKIGPLPWEGKE